MNLHKWCTNVPQFNEQGIFPFDRNSEQINTVKTLGLLWNSFSDTFTYKVSVRKTLRFTKRDVLSQIARIYDPLGLLGPVISKAKIFMQQLWLLKLTWNEILPSELSQQWEAFIDTLQYLETISVLRCVLLTSVKSIIVQGFADSSSKAYGAVVYIQAVSKTGETRSQLLCSKSRGAPLKMMTIPRLELAACLLLVKLTNKVLAALKEGVDSVKLWTDSSIALSWINTSPHLLKTFVANRVSQIQQLSKDFQWRHISSECNPADALSRGLDAKTLAAYELWWNGPGPSTPDISTQDAVEIPIISPDKLYCTELKTVSKVTLTTHNSDFFEHLLNLTNDFQKLIRILAFIFRFIYNCRYEKKKDFLSTEEFARAEGWLFKTLQVIYLLLKLLLLLLLKLESSIPHSSKIKFYPRH
ncbi:integrase catalytic domain-containing protein [Trichonephila clavata]|uniref:Integrase catalytic domain-containing protein n=1 Tax=Trichonephila clavata TaxID=2740835 RepID=A0A8X6G9R9_TRICU|nr:integrase catalytic domain-containing protein [Trichonephila clavata]